MRRRHRLLATVLACLLVLGCTPKVNRPPAGLPDATDLAKKIAVALSELDTAKAPIHNDPTSAHDELALITENMEGKPQVKLSGPPRYDAEARTAQATLDVTWPYQPKPWAYQTVIDMTYVNGQWWWKFAPRAVYPKLGPQSRLAYTRLVPERGRILGANGTPIMERHTVFNVGLDKTRCDPSRWDASARAVAGLVGIDGDTFAKAVAAAGAKAFVSAITLRDKAPDGLDKVEGGRAIKDSAMLAPYRNFGGALLGSVGPATKEDVEASKGALRVGEEVGHGGLSGLHDAALRGTAGYRVDLLKRDESYTPPASAGPIEILPVMATKVAAVNGKDLSITVDVGLQTRLEEQLKDAPIPSSVVMVQPSTGKILAMAAGPAGQTSTIPWRQKDAPGSTFKIVSSLGLLRAGLTPDSPVECTSYAMVNGQRINNWDGLPQRYFGTISLRDAVGISCNAAFINSRSKLGGAALADAAASLGMATDSDLGFGVFLAEAPPTTNENELAAQTFGQGNTQASLVGLTGMAASVKAGKTTVPWLVEGFQPKPKGKPLTSTEAAQLQDLMHQVTVIGLEGTRVVAGAKTGTAQFTRNGEMFAHGWLIGYTEGDLAIGVFQDTEADHNYTLGMIAKALS